MGVARTYHAIILLVYPALGSDIRKLHQLVSYFLKITGNLHLVSIESPDLLKVGWLLILALINGRTAAEYEALCWHIGDQFIMHVVLQIGVFGYFSNLHAVNVPFVEDP